MLFDIHKPITPVEDQLRQRKEHHKALREMEEFKVCITNIVERYIKSVDSKISTQDLEIKRMVNSLTDDITNIVTDIINEGIIDGRFGVAVTYDEATESLNIVASGGV